MRQDRLSGSLRRGGRCPRRPGGGVGAVLSNVLKKRSCISRTAPRLLCTLEPGVDTKLRFTLEPAVGQSGFQQWYDALKAVARLPTGIPKEWRRKVWLTLADHYLHSIAIDWDKTLRFTFNDRSNPDDDSMGVQIVKDLHRTGCSAYCGQAAERDRVVLKRVLLAYARWNKRVGYCQGFNILAALILEVAQGDEGDALKIMIYLIDKVLPESYFVDNLRALCVDMAVFRDLLRLELPQLAQHLDALQRGASERSGGGYEPPLTNVFTMQWFLTLFATCLPTHTVLKIWDSVFFEGSEIILRVSLAIWAKLGEQIERCASADEFYGTMGRLTQEMLAEDLVAGQELMQTVYAMAPFPFPHLAALREKYTYNITPFPAPPAAGPRWRGRPGDSDEEKDPGEEDAAAAAVGCLGPLSGLLAPELQRYHRPVREAAGEQSPGAGSIAELSPGAVAACRRERSAAAGGALLERASTDVAALQRQYARLRRRRQQLCIRADQGPATSLLPSQVSAGPVINHLLLGKKTGAAGRGARSAAVRAPGDGPAAQPSSPWRAHMRVPRKAPPRPRGQPGCGDTAGLTAEPGDGPGAARAPEAAPAGGDADVAAVQAGLESLELAAAAPAFSPFPSVKPLRKSAAARSLGLYGPSERTPAVPLPRLSRGLGRPAGGGSTKRR